MPTRSRGFRIPHEAFRQLHAISSGFNKFQIPLVLQIRTGQEGYPKIYPLPSDLARGKPLRMVISAGSGIPNVPLLSAVQSHSRASFRRFNRQRTAVHANRKIIPGFVAGLRRFPHSCRRHTTPRMITLTIAHRKNIGARHRRSRSLCRLRFPGMRGVFSQDQNTGNARRHSPLQKMPPPPPHLNERRSFSLPPFRRFE